MTLGSAKKFGIVAAVASLFIWLAGCSVSQDDTNASCGKEPADVTEKRLAAFSDTLHALLVQQTCTQCHTKSAGKAPYVHSDSDVPTAYTDARELSDFR